MTYIDLSQTIKPGIPDWDGCCGFQFSETNYPNDICVQDMVTPLGIGTHMDAPLHMIKNGIDIATINPSQLMVLAVVIDISDRTDANYFLTLEDVQDFEIEYGAIQPNQLILIHTGWSKYWGQPDKYRNVNANGQRQFPGVSVEVANYLVSKSIVGIGIDTLSPDGGHIGFPVHKILLGAGLYILENLCQLDKLPPVGTKIIALPMKIKNGSEAPTRVIAKVRN